MSKTKIARNLRARSTEGPIARDKYFSRAVSKALEALEFLQTESNALPMMDIAQRLQLSKTSAFRLLRTLETTGYVALDGRGHYKLAPGIHAVTPTQWLGKLVRSAMPHLHAINLEFTETASLAAFLENRIEVVAVVESPHDIRMSNVIGHILPPNASSLGKVIAAFQPPIQRERLLRSFKIYRFTDLTITDQKDLSREYENIRLQKFAVDREECAPGGICFSVPVFGVGEQVSAAISLSMPKTRLRNPEQERLIIATLRAAANQLASDLENA
jgi:DNA-binding IclR family transcriptional regulator